MLYQRQNIILNSKVVFGPIGLFTLIFLLFNTIKLNAGITSDEDNGIYSASDRIFDCNKYITADDNELYKRAIEAITKGAEYFHSLNIHGGYVYNYLLDGSRRWGELEYQGETIEVQPPGTPAVGVSFIKAYEATGNNQFLNYAEETAGALISGQNKYGGWDHTITFGDNELSEDVSFDDNQTQSAVRFLMMLDQYSNKSFVRDATIKAIKLMLESQTRNGAWPHYYPEQGNYHDYATFNDGGINDCIKVMTDAYKYYGLKEYLASIELAGRYIYRSQLPPPQPGWAQQYNEFMQPAWARTFEPPSVCPMVTIRNINSLLDLYLLTEDDFYLEPVPDAIKWLKESRMSNGKWARFIEIGTNKPLYYDRGRIRVNSPEELSVERRLTYGYQQDLKSILDSTVERYGSIVELGKEKYLKRIEEYKGSEEYLDNLRKDVINIIAEQDSQGRWITKNDKFKNKVPGKLWKGDFLNADRISSYKFNYYIGKLSEYISANKQK